MSMFASQWFASTGASAYLLEQSLLFDGSTTYLSRTPSTAGNRKTWTYSVWFKRAKIAGTSLGLLSVNPGGPQFGFATQGNEDLEVYGYTAGYDFQLRTTPRFRDPAAWFHAVVAVDTTQATASDRVKLYVNGTRITAFDTETYPALNYDSGVNSTTLHSIGSGPTPPNSPWGGLMALPILVDGAALAPTDFGETDDDGFWNPIEFTGATTTDLISPATGTAEDTGTTSFGYAGRVIANAFDGVTVATDANSANTANHTTPAALGKDWGTSLLVTRAVVYGQSGSAGIHGVGTFDLTLQGWNGSAWVDLSTLAGLSGSAGQIEVLNYSGGVSYSKHRVLIDEISNSEQTAVAELQFFTESTSEGFGTNGFQLDFADTTFFGKNVSGTDDQAALSSAAPAATAWLNITSAWTMGSGTASRTTTVNAIRSASVFTGDFSLALTMASGATAARLGVYAANEDSTFVSSGADSAGMDSMTNSFYANFGAASFYKGSSTTASVSQTNGAITITRVSGTITINTAGGNHTFAATYTGPMRFVLAGGGATMSFTGIAYTSDGQAGNSYFDNNFTASDQLEDTPTDSVDDGIGNYITLNPNDRNNTSLVLTEGNTYLTASGDGGIKGTIFVDSGEHHFEYVAVSTTTNNMSVGVTLATSSLTNETPTTGDYAFNIRNGTEGGRAYDIFANGTTIATGSLPAAPNGENIGVVFDADAGTLKFYNSDLAASGDLIYTISSIPAGSYTVLARSSNNTHIFDFNFGQRPFVDTNLNNANAIATQNLPAPTVADGSQYFNTVLYTGTGSELAITSLDFTPDFVWIKNRDATDNHMLYDSVRGATKDLHSNTQDAETTTAQTLKSFDSAGFTLGTDVQVNTNTEDYVAWCWKAGGAAVSNTDGTITSSVSANTTSGFSIVSYTGSGTASDTVGHGLSTIPSLIIARNRTQSGSWCVTHESLSADKVLRFEGTNAEGDIADGELDSPPNNSSTFGFNNGTSGTPLKAVNASSIPYIAYCWSEVEGFSKFGSYTGNGSADGPFVYTGFIPACIIFKKVSSTSNWGIFDNSRDPYNEVDHILFPNLTNAEVTPAYAMDFLSNGVKLRNTSDIVNVSGQTYIYMAFAEHPLQGADGVTQARAR